MGICIVHLNPETEVKTLKRHHVLSQALKKKSVYCSMFEKVK